MMIRNLLRQRRAGWFQVVGIVAAGVVLGLVLPHLERGRVPFGTFHYDASSAQATLGAIASGMITLTGFVFTAITLVIQTVQNMSPRLFAAVRSFDRYPRLFGVFVATFTYALIVLSQVRTNEVPQLSVTLAVVMVLVSAALFLRLLLTLRNAVTAGGLIRTVAGQLREVIDQVYPPITRTSDTRNPNPAPPVSADAHQPPPARRLLHHRGEPGVFQGFDSGRLVRLACERGVSVEFLPAVGDFVATGAHLATVTTIDDGSMAALSEQEIDRLIRVGPARTIEQDPAYGLRLLVDIAIRALSPAVNDPTTAVQSLDQIDDVLSLLAGRNLGDGSVRDADGRVRIQFPAPTWPALAGLALDEIIAYGAGSLQVVRRLRAVLEDVARVCSPDRLDPITERLSLLDRLVAENFPDPATRQRALCADRQGLGSPFG